MQRVSLIKLPFCTTFYLDVLHDFFYVETETISRYIIHFMVDFAGVKAIR